MVSGISALAGQPLTKTGKSIGDIAPIFAGVMRCTRLWSAKREDSAKEIRQHAWMACLSRDALP